MGVIDRMAGFIRDLVVPTESKAVAVQRERDGLDESPPFYSVSMTSQPLAAWDQKQGLDSNVIMAPVCWIMRTFTEAVARVQSRTLPEEGGQQPTWGYYLDHPAELLLEDPNPFYDGDILWQATLVSFVLGGNAYQRKIRSEIGEPVELWYLPHWLVTPKYRDSSRYIDYYEYRRPDGGEPDRIAPRDMIHYRFGLDPRDTRMGISPIRPLLREIGTDDEAQIFSAAILRNMGVPGLLVSPKENAPRPTQADVDEMKDYMQQNFTGSRRGKALVLGTPTDVNQFGFDPNKLMLTNLRDVAEERVCAMLGLPAPVVGFGSGMQATKVGATMREFVKLAWVQCLSPMQTSMSRQATRQLLPDFVSQTRRYRIRFDTSEVAGFQEDDNQAAERASKLVLAGILRVDRAQAMLGLEVDDTQKVYLRPSASTAYDENGNPVEPPKPPTPPAGGDPIPGPIADRMGGGAPAGGNGNGNGNGSGGN